MLTLMDIGESLGRIGSAIMQPLYWAVSGIIVFFHDLLAFFLNPDSGLTWTLSIVLLTVFIRLIMMPLYAKQLNSSRAMQALQPKLEVLQKKYGSDREKLGQETMKLYQEEGVNPASSCAPLLIQLPIFFALFRVLSSASTGQNVHGYWLQRDPELVHSLSHANIFGAQLSGTFLPINNGFGATQILATILIILMTVLMFFQQLHMLKRNMPPSALTGPMAQQQKMMLYLFPAMYLFTGLAIPIGVLVYWLTTNLWTMAQQYFIIRNYPTPGTPAYVEWEDRMREQGKDPRAIEERRANKARKHAASAPVVTSGSDTAGHAVVARQHSTRQTVRSSSGERQVVVRRTQPVHQTRSARKKK
ncbi:YidC/Oxa1 family membrane protein insertase [Propionibacterium cyclohexanicum]|uniref:Membrane protein insertase YidC n=1 Tax=Propionibacterium cyclohexanicum TaxID=64702 RepID=A0A1H9TRX7_9ACTN|nr:membrane protein insertase YidC [Propionibacterium cyclohexanicum]SES00060.1 YidC/Oxa1 family membrane protein insertase [Propionibacterium cyclohexanicum]